MYRQLSKEAKNESNEINNGHHLNRTASMPNSTASSLNQLRNSTVSNEDERQRLHCKNAIHLAVPMAKKVLVYIFTFVYYRKVRYFLKKTFKLNHSFA